MLRSRLIVLVVSIAFCGCATDGTAATATPAGSRASDTASARPARTETGLALELRQYYDENFGAPGYETSWYHWLDHVEINGEWIDVHTNRVNPDEIEYLLGVFMWDWKRPAASTRDSEASSPARSTLRPSVVCPSPIATCDTRLRR